MKLNHEHRLVRFQIKEYACLSLIFELQTETFFSRKWYYLEHNVVVFFAFVFSIPWLNAIAPGKLTVNAIKQKMIDRPCDYIDTCSIFRILHRQVSLPPPSSIPASCQFIDLFNTFSFDNRHEWTKFHFGWKQKSDVTQCFALFQCCTYYASNSEREQKTKTGKSPENAKTKYFLFREKRKS